MCHPEPFAAPSLRSGLRLVRGCGSLRVNSAKGHSRGARRCFTSFSMTLLALVVNFHNRRCGHKCAAYGIPGFGRHSSSSTAEKPAGAGQHRDGIPGFGRYSLSSALAAHCLSRGRTARALGSVGGVFLKSSWSGSYDVVILILRGPVGRPGWCEKNRGQGASRGGLASYI